MQRGLINSIQFGLMSGAEIEQLSVLEITSHKLGVSGSPTDPRLGSATSSPREICPTCKLTANKCPGHVGHIKLNYPIFHPLFDKTIIKLLRLFCYSCFRFTKTTCDNQYVPFDKLTKNSDKNSRCPHCGKKQPTWSYGPAKIYIKQVFPTATLLCSTYDIYALLCNLSREDLELIRITQQPENMIITVLPISPPSTRPSISSDEKIHDDHLTIQYMEIVRANLAVKTAVPIRDQIKQINTLIYRIATLFNNSKARGRYGGNNKVIQGYKERLQGKSGVPRNALMGKRVNQSGRTVIGPEPTLRINQVAIPREMAQILTRRETVCIYNQVKLQQLLNAGQVKLIHRAHRKTGELQAFDCRYMKDKTLQIGDVIDRFLHADDIVLANRQPTLHSGSMMAKNAVLSDSRTICFNLSNTSTFNADFDGDEMNVHIPQDYQTASELNELASIQNHLLSQKNGSANITLVQDNLLALYLMTSIAEGDLELDQEEYNDSLMSLVDESGADLPLSEILMRRDQIGARINAATGRGLVAHCLPPDFQWAMEDLVITDGVPIRPNDTDIARASDDPCLGAINKARMRALFEVIYHAYSATKLEQVINNLQFITNRWLDIRGFSIGLGDCLLKSKSDYSLINESIARCHAHAEMVSETWRAPQIREIRVLEALNRGRDTGMKIAKNAYRRDNNFIHTVTSGSKGDFFNMCQISGLLGQQYVKDGRIGYGMNYGARALYHFPIEGELTLEQKYEARGFVSSSFVRGITPIESYMHAVCGRIGVVDTSMGTAETGYTQRRLIKLMEDILVTEDGLVRGDLVQEKCADGSIRKVRQIYQLSFGSGLDVVHSPSTRVIDTIVARLNNAELPAPEAIDN